MSQACTNAPLPHSQVSCQALLRTLMLLRLHVAVCVLRLVAGGWKRLAGAGAGPKPRYSHGSAVVHGRDNNPLLVISHGYNKETGATWLQDTWIRPLGSSTAMWQEVSINGTRPAARYGHSFGAFRWWLDVMDRRMLAD